ncbi:hypothetical protein SK128_009069, partial [Halocaridina rubra]
MLRSSRRLATWIIDKDWTNTINHIITYQSWTWNVCVLLVISAAHQNLPSNTATGSSSNSSGSSGSPNPTSGWLTGGKLGFALDSLLLLFSAAATAVTSSSSSSSDSSGWVGAGELESSNMPDTHLCKLVLAAAILVFWAAFWIIHLISIIYG